MGRNKIKNRAKNEIQRLSRQLIGRGSLESLCLKAAEILGKPWDGTKAAGYLLLTQVIALRAQGGLANELSAARAEALAKRERRALAREHLTGSDPNSESFLFSYEWRSVRMRVLKRFGARCQCCGASAKDGVRINVDHIKPRRLFPALALDESNLQVLCEACNHGKGNWDQTDWRPAVVVEPPADHRPVWRALINVPE